MLILKKIEWEEMSCGEKRRGEKCLVGRNVIWGEMSWGEMSWGEMLRGELSFGVKCYRAVSDPMPQIRTSWKECDRFHIDR